MNSAHIVINERRQTQEWIQFLIMLFGPTPIGTRDHCRRVLPNFYIIHLWQFKVQEGNKRCCHIRVTHCGALPSPLKRNQKPQ